jgi:hypothetical protein
LATLKSAAAEAIPNSSFLMSRFSDEKTTLAPNSSPKSAETRVDGLHNPNSHQLAVHKARRPKNKWASDKTITRCIEVTPGTRIGQPLCHSPSILNLMTPFRHVMITMNLEARQPCGLEHAPQFLNNTV